MTKFPAGIPNYQFLLNEGGIRFKGAFFRWLVEERMGKLILSATGFALFLLGIVTNTQKKAALFYFSMLASVAAYFSVFASGNVRHDYYQIPTIFVFSIFMGVGANVLINPPKEIINKYLSRVVLAGLVLLMVALGYYEVQGYYWINKPQIIEAGQAVDKLLPKDATVVAPYDGDTAFLYQTNRRGYPITDRPLTQFIDQGTKYLVSVDPTDAGIANLAKNCNVIAQTNDYVIIEMFDSCIGK